MKSQRVPPTHCVPPTRRRRRFARKLPGALHKHIIIACLNSVAGVNPAVLIDRAERGLRKIVGTSDELPKLCSSCNQYSIIGKKAGFRNTNCGRVTNHIRYGSTRAEDTAFRLLESARDYQSRGGK